MDTFLTILICLMGLCWGSFLNVLIVRTLSGESIIFPPSKCPKCDVPLHWWQNIPIISYFILKGRCAFCNAPISIQYPIIEIVGLIMFLFAFNKYQSKFDAISVIITLSMLLTLAYTDLKKQEISKTQMFIIMICGLIFNRYDLFNAILGGLIASCIIIILTNIGLKIFKKETFGVGDIYLLGAFGTIVGFENLFMYLIYALIIQVIFILPSYIMTLWRNEKAETLKYLIFFIITCLFLYVLRNFSSTILNPVFIVILASMLYFAYKLTRSLIDTLKTQQTTSYCPLAPAIAISCLLYLI